MALEVVDENELFFGCCDRLFDTFKIMQPINLKRDHFEIDSYSTCMSCDRISLALSRSLLV